jgi:hypothetical protein
MPRQALDARSSQPRSADEGGGQNKMGLSASAFSDVSISKIRMLYHTYVRKTRTAAA